MRSFVFGLLSVAFLTSCQPTVGELRKEVEKGIGGFTGQVTPFSVPVLLRYQGPAKATFITSWAIRPVAGEPQNGSTRANTSLDSIGDQRLFEMQMIETVINGRAQRSVNPPLAAVRALANSRGPIRNIDLTFPAFTESQIREMREKTPKFDDHLKNRLSYSLIELPEQSVSSGDVLISPREFLRTMVASDFGEDLYTEVSRIAKVRSNSLSAKVAGQTWQGGRQMLVLVIAGMANVDIDSLSITIAVNGHWLIDMKTGLTGGYLTSAEFVFQHNGETKRAEGVIRSETIF